MLTALGLILIGQCDNGRCILPPSQVVLQAPAVQAPRYQASPAYRWLKVNYQGLTPYVWGYQLSNGLFRWDPDLPANAEQVSKARASASGKAPAQRFRVTVIGTAAECAPVIRDLATHATFQDVRDVIDAQAYRPGDWAVSASLGFNNTGNPSILVQTEDGKAIAQASDYQHGPERLSQVIHQAVRRRDPTYDARKVPEVSKEEKQPEKKPEPQPKIEEKTKASVIPEVKDTLVPVKTSARCPLGFTREDYPEIAAAGAVIGIFYFKKRKMR